jgi:enolase-phosphatase E1
MSSAIRHVLLDIEGTTCPVTFVSEVLFPYAQAQLAAYLQGHAGEPRLRALQRELLASWRQEPDAAACDLLRGECQRFGVERGEDDLPAEALLPYLQWLDRHDRKLTAWKDLQGLIWEEGYRSGAIQADLYPEVAATLRRWYGQGLVLSVYSSGSVAAQKLLYAHSRDGDLCPLFSHWFDTRIGAKNDPQSYLRILKVLDCDAEQVVFVSDALRELEAAAAVGLHCWFSDRPGNPQRRPGGFPVIAGLDQIQLDAQDPAKWAATQPRDDATGS